MKISRIRITPVAFADPPLLNAVGLHEPFALRAIIQLETDDGLIGLGETYADEAHLTRLAAAADALVGLDVFDTNAMRTAVASALHGSRGSDRHGLTGEITATGTIDRALSPFEVAALDVQGKAL
ncbi:MAG TPA: hypothetical protein VH395_13295, partial [Jatrophihabitantaceae bacterium]